MRNDLKSQFFNSSIAVIPLTNGGRELQSDLQIQKSARIF